MRTAILAAMAIVALSSNPFTHRGVAAHCQNAVPPQSGTPKITTATHSKRASQYSAPMLARRLPALDVEAAR